MESKHTYQQNQQEGDYSILDERGEVLGFMYDEENAKQAAAAPDLLEALKAVYLHLRDGVQTGETASLYNQVCAALAKAS